MSADYKLDISWNGEKLQNDKFPVYLGVTLDRTLSFNEHCKKVKGKVAKRNNILRKLTNSNSNWGTDPQTLKITAMAAQLLSIALLCGQTLAMPEK